MRAIKVVDYDPTWPEMFEVLRSRIHPAVQDIALAIEHVGSTSVPGLAAKPMIDIDIVVLSKAHIPVVIKRLAALGYEHLGDLGIEGRDAFEAPAGSLAHHLYACVQGSLGLENHLAVRGYLRLHPDQANAYGELKKRLAQQFPHDIDSYIAGKTDFILEILRVCDFERSHIESIEQINRGNN